MAAQGAVPYAIVGGVLALLVFLLLCLLATMVWCSIRQKGGWGGACWEGRGLLGGWSCIVGVATTGAALGRARAGGGVVIA